MKILEKSVIIIVIIITVIIIVVVVVAAIIIIIIFISGWYTMVKEVLKKTQPFIAYECQFR